jgi:putative flippase GtrA
MCIQPIASKRQKPESPMFPLLRYGTVSVITTIGDVAIFSLLAVWLGMQPVIANCLSYSTVVVICFYLTRYWVFPASKGDRAPSQFGRFITISLLSLVLSTVLVALFVRFTTPFVAKLLTLPITFAWNYVINRTWVFGVRRGSDRYAGT